MPISLKRKEEEGIYIYAWYTNRYQLNKQKACHTWKKRKINLAFAKTLNTLHDLPSRECYFFFIEVSLI